MIPKIKTNKKNLMLIIFALVLLIGGIIAWDNKIIKNVSAVGENWLVGWQHRRPITVSGRILNKTGTIYGNTTLGSTTSKFGTSAYFDGSGDYITLPDSDDYAFGTGDFTIDFWMKRGAVSNAEEGILGQHIASGNGNPRNIIAIQSNNTLWMYEHYYYDGNLGSLFTTQTVADTNWHHVAYVRSSGTLYVYIDGVQCGSKAWANSGDNPNLMYIGYTRDSYGNAAYFKGNLDELRISKGIARWTSNFTPPTTAYVADSYDKLLLHFDEVAGVSLISSDSVVETLTNYQTKVDLPYLSTMQSDLDDVRFTSSNGSTQLDYWFDDNNKKGKVNGGPTFGSTTSKFGTATSFDGTDDYVSFEDSNDFDFGTGNFTIDMWVYPTSSPSQYAAMIGSGTSSSYEWMISAGVGDGTGDQYKKFNFYASGPAVSLCDTTVLATNTWTHVAVVRNGTSWTLYRNGTSVATTTSSAAFNMSSPLLVGGIPYGTMMFNGLIDEVRISKGVARWTSNFVATSLSVYEPDQYTKLLLHLNEASGSTIIDSNNFIFSTGTAYNSPTLGSTGKIGTGVLFDGTNDYVSFEASNNWYFGKDDFTIDFWANQSSYADRYPFQIGDVASTKVAVDLVSASRIVVFVGSTTLENTSLTVPTGWNHYALVRSKGALKFYLNGVSIMSGTQTGEVGSASEPLNIGAYINTTYQNYWNGYIDEVRISKGVARWTANFTPSTLAYEPDQYTILLAHLDEVSGTEIGYVGTIPFWVEVPTVSGAVATIYAYYGNSSVATTANGDNTFKFFDDFNTATINTSKWDGDTSVASVSNGTLSVLGANANYYLTSIQEFSFPNEAVFKGYLDPVNGGDHFLGFTDATRVQSQEIRWYPGGMSNNSGTPIKMYINGVYTLTDDNLNLGWKEYDIKWLNTSINWYRDGVEGTNSPIISSAPTVSLPVTVRPYSPGTWKFDYIFVKNATAATVLASIGSEDNPNGFVIKKDDGCACESDSECYYGTCSNGTCGVGGPSAINLTVPSETE